MPTPPLMVVSREGPKPLLTAARAEIRGGGNLRTMKEVNPDTTLLPLFYCTPVNDKGGPCHASDCDHHSGCVLQLKRVQQTKDGKQVNNQDQFRCTNICGSCGNRCYYGEECHIKERESDKLNREEAEKTDSFRNPRECRQVKNGRRQGGWQG